MAVKYVVQVNVGNGWKTQASFDDKRSAMIIHNVNESNDLKSKVVCWDQAKTCIRIAELAAIAIILVMIVAGIASGALLSVILAPEFLGALALSGIIMIVAGVTMMMDK